jgi:hypothetical protein
MKTKHFFVYLIVLATVAGITGRAHAQAFDKEYAKSITLAGNQTDAVHTITIVAPTLSPATSFSLTLPAALPGSTGLALVSNTTTGGLTWSTSAIGTVTSVAMTVPSFLSIGGSPITSNGTLALTLSGTALPVANGGTGLTTLTNHSIQVGAGTSNVTQLAVGAAGQILTGVASADPAWSSTPTLGVGGSLAGSLTIANGTASNTGTTTIQTGLQGATSITYTLPTTAPTSAGTYYLSTASTSSPYTLNWASPGTGFILNQYTAQTSAGFDITAGAPAKTAAFTEATILNDATSSTASIAKTGLSLSSTGSWSGTTATNTGLTLNVTGGTTNTDILGTSSNWSVSSAGAITLGKAGSTLGSVSLANTINTNLVTIEAPVTGTPPAVTYILPATAPTAVGQLMEVSNITGNTVTMQWNSSSSPPQYYNQSTNITSPGNDTTSGEWVGLSHAAGYTFTPKSTGRFLITITGNMFMSNNTGSSGTALAAVQMYYEDAATNVAPTHATTTPATSTATSLGPICTISIESGTHDEQAPFCVSAYVSGLTVGHNYWIDGWNTWASGCQGSALNDIQFTVIELP